MKSNMSMIQKMKSKMIWKVFAEESQGGEDQTNTNSSSNSNTGNSINYETLIARARQEEKDKLYPQLETLKKEKQALINKNNQQILDYASKDDEIKQLKKEIDKLNKELAKKESANVKELKNTITLLENEKEVLTNEIEQLKVNHQKELSARDLADYKKTKIAEANGKIIPELVSGDTIEDIDASFTKAVERYTEIIGKANVTPPSITNMLNTTPPNADTGLNTISVSDIQNINNADDWNKMRKQLGLK